MKPLGLPGDFLESEPLPAPAPLLLEHCESPAQCPFSPQAPQDVRAFRAFNFRLRSSNERLERPVGNLLFPPFFFPPGPLCSSAPGFVDNDVNSKWFHCIVPIQK